MTTIGFKNRDLLFVSAVIILLSSYAAAAVSTGNDKTLNAGQCFDFSAGNVTLNISNCDLTFSGNCSQNNQGCMNPWTLHANASGKIKGIGPGVNISNVWKVSEMNGSMSMYTPSFPLYMATDGLSIVTSEGNYGAFVVDNISADSSYIIFDYRYQDNSSNVVGERPATGCASYEQQECFNAQQQGMNCFWEGFAQVCMEQSGPGPGGHGPGGPGPSGPGSAGCWNFDFNENSCRFVMGCTYCNATNVNSSGNPCYGMGIGLCQGGGPNQQIACQNITDQSMCNKIPMLSTCCQWVNSTCQELTTNNSCHNIMPPQGKNFCNDWNVTTKADCDEIAGMPYFMPCTWDNVSNKCSFRQDKMFNGSGNFGDIQSQSNCEAAGGKWRVEFYTVIDQYGEKSVKDEWCEMGTGMQTCDNDCWACEYKPGQAGSPSGRWENISAATAACEGSALGFCYWEQDPNNISMSKQDGGAPGWCFPLQQINFGGGNCDMNCFDCFAETPAKAKDRCDNSKAGCKWFWDNQQNTSGWCDKNNVKSCDQDCFMCYDSASCDRQGLGGNITCKWDIDNVCKPKVFSGEICFNGVDDNGDQKIDCADSDCTFDQFCGGNSGNDCGRHHDDNTTCVNTPGCAWIRDQFCDTCYFCGREEELCFMAEGNQNLCNERNDTCNWITQQDCDVNKSMAQVCFHAGNNETACNASNNICVWRQQNSMDCGGITQIDPCINTPGCSWESMGSICVSDIPTGFCDFKLFTCNNNMDNGSCANQSGCSWVQDYGGSPGHCEPVCFMLNATGCHANSYCQIQQGFCEPKKFAKMDDCPMHMNESSCGEYNQTCAWINAPGGASCDVNKALSRQTCGAAMMNSPDPSVQQAACANLSDSGCAWIEGGMGGQGMSGAFCGPKVAQCFMNKTRQQNKESCEAPSWNETLCKWVFNHCEPRCMGLDTTACGSDPQCMVVSGFCNPKMMNEMFGSMEGGPPVEIARDPCGPGSHEDINSSQSDICLLGIKDSPASFGFGLGVSNIYSAAICHEFNPGASKTTKFYWYLDTDGNGTNNCNARDSSTSNQTGFEFFFKYEGQMLNNNLSEIRVAYKCVSGDWAPTQIKLSSWTRKMCQELGGGMVAVDKTDLKKFPNLFDPTKLMRIYATSADNTTNMSTPLDKIGPGWYTPGTADFRFEDCRAPGQDLDGDGFTSENDPDCQDIKRFGFVQVEDCYPDGIDNDGNGLVDCNETHCRGTPRCLTGGAAAFNWTKDPNDHIAPRVTRHNVEKFNDGAFVMFDTNEPSNGSILFYKTDSACGTLNRTIIDNGDPNCNATGDFCKFDDFKMPHFAPIDNFQFNPYKLNYTLEQNTSYFYKMQNCDPSGNCALSGCLNFTTLSSCRNFTFRFVFEGDANNSMMSSMVFDFDWNADGTWDVLGKDMSMTGVRINCTTGKYVNIRMRNPSENWSLLLKGAKMLDAKTVNITGGMLGGNASNGTKFLGLDSDKWQDLFQNLGVEGVELTVPNPGINCTNLTIKNCNDDGQNCTEVTSSTDKVCNNATITIKIPVSLGFTTYMATGTVVAAAQNETLVLSLGWNVVSLPLSNTGYGNAESLLDTSGCTMMSKYENGGMMTHMKDTTMFNFAVNMGEGYYAYCPAPANVSLTGDEVTNVTVYLEQGWNVIGLIKATTANETMAGIADCLSVARYTGSGFETWDGTSGVNFNMTTGRGYFAYVENAGNWTMTA